jgi:hypothetical protein
MLSAGAASAATCGQAGSGNFTEVGTTISEGVCYTAYTDSVYNDWSVAQAFAQSLTAGGSAGNLATAADQTQYNALAALLASLPADFLYPTGTDYSGAWIGLRTTQNGYTPSTVSDLLWVDGNSSTFVRSTNDLWQGGAGPQSAISNNNPSGCGSSSSNLCSNIYTLMDGSGGLDTLGAYAADQPSLMIGAVVESLATTPLPAALPLFAGGLGALGLLGLRRKRKAAAIAA